jgi:hypothetical protein
VQAQIVKTKQIYLPHYRVIRGFDGLVRVDIAKAQEAMRHAMEIREQRRASDEARNELISSHATR